MTDQAWLAQFKPHRLPSGQLEQIVENTLYLWNRGGFDQLNIVFAAPIESVKRLRHKNLPLSDDDTEAQSDAIAVIAYIAKLSGLGDLQLQPANQEQMRAALGRLIELGEQHYCLFERCSSTSLCRAEAPQIEGDTTPWVVQVGMAKVASVSTLQRQLNEWGLTSDLHHTHADGLVLFIY